MRFAQYLSLPGAFLTPDASGSEIQTQFNLQCFLPLFSSRLFPYTILDGILLQKPPFL